MWYNENIEIDKEGRHEIFQQQYFPCLGSSAGHLPFVPRAGFL
jgi:hypothetical protein